MDIIKEKRPTGRPQKPIDWDKVDYLLECGCTGPEIASHFDLHHNTFYERIAEKYEMSFTEYRDEKRQKGDSILKEAQFQKAISGDNTMLIWLGKVRLGQSDKDKNDNADLFTLFKDFVSSISKNNGTVPGSCESTGSNLET